MTKQKRNTRRRTRQKNQNKKKKKSKNTTKDTWTLLENLTRNPSETLENVNQFLSTLKHVETSLRKTEQSMRKDQQVPTQAQEAKANSFLDNWVIPGLEKFGEVLMSIGTEEILESAITAITGLFVL